MFPFNHRFLSVCRSQILIIEFLLNCIRLFITENKDHLLINQNEQHYSLWYGASSQHDVHH